MTDDDEKYKRQKREIDDGGIHDATYVLRHPTTLPFPFACLTRTDVKIFD